MAAPTLEQWQKMGRGLGATLPPTPQTPAPSAPGDPPPAQPSAGAQGLEAVGGQALSFGKGYAKEVAGEAGADQGAGQWEWARKAGVPNLGKMAGDWAKSPDTDPNATATWAGKKAAEWTPAFLPMGNLGLGAGLGKTIKGVTDRISPDLEYVGKITDKAQEMVESGKNFTQAEWEKAGLDPELWAWATEQPSRFKDWLAQRVSPETADKVVQSIVRGAQTAGRALGWTARGAAGGMSANPQNQTAGAETGAVGATAAGATNLGLQAIPNPVARLLARGVPLAAIVAAYEAIRSGHHEWVPFPVYHALMGVGLPAIAAMVGGITGNPTLSGTLTEEGAKGIGYDQPPLR